jgi:hypothetical protein
MITSYNQSLAPHSQWQVPKGLAPGGRSGSKPAHLNADVIAAALDYQRAKDLYEFAAASNKSLDPRLRYDLVELDVARAEALRKVQAALQAHQEERAAKSQARRQRKLAKEARRRPDFIYPRDRPGFMSRKRWADVLQRYFAEVTA